MQLRTLSAALLVPAFLLAACGDDSTGLPDTSSNATVQFINASNATLDVTTNGTVAAGNGPLGYGIASSCMSLDAASPGLAVRTTGTNAGIPGFTPAFSAGGSYTVIAYAGTAGAIQFITLSNAFTPAPGQAGLRVANVGPAGSSYDVYVAAPNAALATPSANNVGVGSGSSYFNVTAASAQHIAVTNAGTKTVVLDFGSSNAFTAAKRSTLVITPFPTNANQPAGFLVTGC